MINALGSVTLQPTAVNQRFDAFKAFPNAAVARQNGQLAMAAGLQGASDSFTRTGRPHKHDFNAKYPLLRF